MTVPAPPFPPDALARPADEAVAKGLARAADQGRFHPVAFRFQDMHDAADHPPLASGIRRKMRLRPRKRLIRQPEKMIGFFLEP